MDVNALEEVVRKLSGRRHQQQLAIKEKARPAAVSAALGAASLLEHGRRRGLGGAAAGSEGAGGARPHSQAALPMG
jgi:hypothetical protein